MIDMQLLHGVVLALAVIIGLAAALSAAMLVAVLIFPPSPHPSQPPPGGIRRDLPSQPQPDTDDDRELVLL